LLQPRRNPYEGIKKKEHSSVAATDLHEHAN